MTKKDLNNYIKTLTLDRNKRYIIVVDRKSGLSASDLAQIPFSEDDKDSIFLLVNDISNISAEEYEDFERYKQNEVKT